MRAHAHAPALIEFGWRWGDPVVCRVPGRSSARRVSLRSLHGRTDVLSLQLSSGRCAAHFCILSNRSEHDLLHRETAPQARCASFLACPRLSLPLFWTFKLLPQRPRASLWQPWAGTCSLRSIGNGTSALLSWCRDRRMAQPKGALGLFLRACLLVSDGEVATSSACALHAKWRNYRPWLPALSTPIAVVASTQSDAPARLLCVVPCVVAHEPGALLQIVSGMRSFAHRCKQAQSCQRPGARTSTPTDGARVQTAAAGISARAGAPRACAQAHARH